MASSRRSTTQGMRDRTGKAGRRGQLMPRTVPCRWETIEVPPTDDPQLHAWVDESMRNDPGKEPLYLLGAVFADPQACDEPREKLRDLLPSGPKLHWHALDGDDETKRRSIETIASFGMTHMVVVAAPLQPKKQERARAKCLERLSWELADKGVSCMFLESRSDSENQKDLNLVEKMRGTQSFPRTVRVEIALPTAEPMLWVPDQVLGALGAEERGDSQYVDLLGSFVQRVPILL